MHLKKNDALATAFVAAAVVVYALWVTGTAMAGVSTRTVGTIVLVLGFAACSSVGTGMAAVYGAGTRRGAPIWYAVVTTLVGAVALVAGVITLVGGTEAMLATLVAALIALWAMATLRHAVGGEAAEPERAAEAPLDRAA